MPLLDTLGLGRKPPRPSLKEVPREPEPKKSHHAIRFVYLAVLVALTTLAFPRAQQLDLTYREGDVWREETLEAPFTFAVRKSQEAIEAERQRVRQETPPYFREVPNVLARMQANRDSVQEQLDTLFNVYGQYRRALREGQYVQAEADSLRYVSLRNQAQLKATPMQWQALLQSYVASQPDLTFFGEPIPASARLDRRLLQLAWEVGASMANFGVVDVPRDSILNEVLFIRSEAERVDRPRSRDNVWGLEEAYSHANTQFSMRLADDPERVALANAFFRSIFQPSLEFIRADTQREWYRKERNIPTTEGEIREGEVVVERGQRITPEVQRRLLSLEAARRERGGITILWQVLLGQVLLAGCTFLLFFLYLYLLRRQIFDDDRQLLLIVLIFSVIVVLYALAVRLESIEMLAVPVGIAAVLLTVMFDSRVGAFGVLTLALIGGHVLRYDFEFTFATLFACTLVVFSVRDIKNRGQFFFSAVLLFGAYVLVLGIAYLLQHTPKERFVGDLLNVGINSFLLVFAYPLLWIFERTFRVTTDLTLLELSNTSRPILRELSQRAPGTFNHSLQVANIAEACADAIGANALLTRVGALYHDIGKMLKPEYFVENQRAGLNPHEALDPRMSALVIASHVREGSEMARQHGLPPAVRRFIPMHHGTTRIEYFYRKALDAQVEGTPPVDEAEFRYPGPRPNSKETAILLLCDSIEAASRSIDEPTPTRLASLIDMIVKARIDDGQLDNSDLTFHDIRRIKETLLDMLVSIYHGRVKYPSLEEHLEQAREDEIVATGAEGERG